MNDLIELSTSGRIMIDARISSTGHRLIALRRKVAWSFKAECLFLSIYNNLKFGLRIHNMMEKKADIMRPSRRASNTSASG